MEDSSNPFKVLVVEWNLLGCLNAPKGKLCKEGMGQELH
jgi:hypothetical protein